MKMGEYTVHIVKCGVAGGERRKEQRLAFRFLRFSVFWLPLLSLSLTPSRPLRSNTRTEQEIVGTLLKKFVFKKTEPKRFFLLLFVKF